MASPHVFKLQQAFNSPWDSIEEQEQEQEEKEEEEEEEELGCSRNT